MKDLYSEIHLSEEEAACRAEKKTEYRKGREKKEFVLEVSPGVIQGTKTRLTGMGFRGGAPGDLLITAKIGD